MGCIEVAHNEVHSIASYVQKMMPFIDDVNFIQFFVLLISSDSFHLHRLLHQLSINSTIPNIDKMQYSIFELCHSVTELIHSIISIV